MLNPANPSIFTATGIDWEAIGKKTSDSAPQGADDWKELAESFLTEQPCVFHRNLEISAFYAGLYLRNPRQFKWAGMAALASSHVRTALLPYHSAADQNGFISPISEDRTLNRLHLNDLRLIRDTNNAIFSDISWFHLAIATENIPPQTSENSTAYQLLEEATKLDRSGERDRATELIWKANLSILWHEQESMVQPRFDKISSGIALLLSLGATMTYHHTGSSTRRDRLGSFTLFMLLHRTKLLLSPLRIPRITELRHRWEWIEHRLVPQFQAYEAENSAFTAQLETIFSDLAELNAKQQCSINHGF